MASRTILHTYMLFIVIFTVIKPHIQCAVIIVVEYSQYKNS